MKRFVFWLTLGWILVWLVGCSAIDFLNQAASTSTPAPSLRAETTPSGDRTPGASNAAVPLGTPGAETVGTTLVIWVAPQFDPNSDNQAAVLFRERLEAFTQENPGVEVDVRVKSVSGSASLVDSLTAASAAAPAVLPDLVCLSRQQLEVAALKGLLIPFDGLTVAIEDEDWYAYAVELATLQGSQFGMPFAGDALVTAYRPAQVSPPLDTWEQVLGQTAPLVFPAADPESLVTTAYFLAEGGIIQDSQGRPVLQAEALTRVLEKYQQAAREGIFPVWIAEFSLDDQAWQVFREQRAQMAFTWVSHLLSNPQADTALSFLPGGQVGPVTFADGWAWALASPRSDRRELAARLAEFLVEPGYLAAWTEASGVLPPRSAALAGWSNQAIRPFLDDLSNRALLRPSEDILITLGPILNTAVLEVIQNQADPIQTAQTAVDSLAPD